MVQNPNGGLPDRVNDLAPYPILRLNPLRGGVDNRTFLNGNLRLFWALPELKIASESFSALPTTMYKKQVPTSSIKSFRAIFREVVEIAKKM